MNGVQLQGLDMAQAASLMKGLGIKRKARERITQNLLVMENAALAAIYGNGES